MGGMKSSTSKRGNLRHQKPQNIGDCDMRFRIDLMGVRAASVKRVRPGDLLEVRLLRDGQMRAVICQTEHGDRIGALSAFPGLAQLIECIEGGAQYMALVERSSAQSCSVFVSRSAG